MKLITCLLCMWMYATCLWSQPAEENSSYLFDDFQDCLIVYKDGRLFQAPVNYDLIRKHYVFKNEENEVLEFEEPEQISYFRIGNRTFLAERKEAVETVQGTPLINVIYTADVRAASKKLTYGGSTQTASVDSYAGLPGSASRMQDNNRVVTGIHKSYEVKVGKRTREFYHKNSFVKLFPKEERKAIEDYLDSSNIDFNSVEQVSELINTTLYSKTKEGRQ